MSITQYQIVDELSLHEATNMSFTHEGSVVGNGVSNSAEDLADTNNGSFNEIFETSRYARYIKINVIAWYNNISMRADVYVDGILQSTPEAQRSYSTKSGNAYSTLDSTQSWTAGSNTENEWMIIDLGTIKNVTGIRILGSSNVSTNFVTDIEVTTLKHILIVILNLLSIYIHIQWILH